MDERSSGCMDAWMHGCMDSATSSRLVVTLDEWQNGWRLAKSVERLLTSPAFRHPSTGRRYTIGYCLIGITVLIANKHETAASSNTIHGKMVSLADIVHIYSHLSFFSAYQRMASSHVGSITSSVSDSTALTINHA